MLKNKSLVFLYCVCLIVFFWRTVFYWSNRHSIGSSMHDITMYLSLGIMEVVSLFTILNKIRFGVEKSGIHRICLAWFLFMIVVLSVNGSSASSLMKTLFFPLLFGFIYFLVKEDGKNEVVLWRLFVLVAIGGLVFFYRSMIAK